MNLLVLLPCQHVQHGRPLSLILRHLELPLKLLNLRLEILEKTDAELSNRLINNPSISFGARRVALMYRHGTLWNNKTASLCCMSKTANCPLCGQLDGVGHIAGGCHHYTMERMYTTRHN